LQVNIKNLIDDGQCYQTVRELRWSDGIACPSCQSKQVIKRGFDDTELARQRYECKDCNTRFDDLMDTIPTVCLDVIFLVASSCGYDSGQIAQRVAR
jgi:transposase-like protein